MSVRSAASVAGASQATAMKAAVTATARRSENFINRKLETLSYSEAGVIGSLSAREIEPDGAETELFYVEAQTDPDVGVVEPFVVIDHDVAESIDDRVGAANAQRSIVAEESDVETAIRRDRHAQFGLEQERLRAVEDLAVAAQLLIG